MPTIFGPMSLGELIDAVSSCAPSKPVVFDWCGVFAPGGFHSYRGFYDHLALWVADPPVAMAAAEFARQCRLQVDAVHHGYKGGRYMMDRQTPVWVAPPDLFTGWGVSGVRDDGACVVIETRRFDD